MSNADRNRYAEAVTSLSEGELQAVLEAAEPPVCLLGGWAVHRYVTTRFQEENDRAYLGSRDIDLGIHVDPSWSAAQLSAAPVATTLARIEDDLGYDRGRFGFYQQFDRDTGERLDDDAARDQPAHTVFRLDIDVIPDTSALDTFQEVFGFRPPAEPLLSPLFESEAGAPLTDYVDWDAPPDVRIPPASLLVAMKVRAFPERDNSHKQLKDLADLHALLWYVTDYDEIKPAVREHLTDADIAAFESMLSEDAYERTAGLIDVDSTIVQQSIERLLG